MVRLCPCVFGLFLSIFILGCASAPKFDPSKTKGQWSGSVVIKNLIAEEENSLDFDAIADDRWGVRMDLSALLGTYVGSLVIRGSKMRLLVAREKKFYKSAADPRAMKKLVGVSFDPKTLESLLFDREPVSGDWQCEKSAEGLLESCQSQRLKTSMTWEERNEEEKTVKIARPGRFEIMLSVNSFQSEVQLESRQFRLTPPKGYRVYRLRAKTAQ